MSEQMTSKGRSTLECDLAVFQTARALALKDLEDIGRAINSVDIGVQVPIMCMIGKGIVVYQLGCLRIENEIMLERLFLELLDV
jgi:hypothetical protein